MSDVRSAEAFAGGAIAIGVERTWVSAEFGALDVETPVVREDGSIAAHARGRYAVEQVDAASDAFDNVFGKSNAHEIPWVGFGEGVFDGFKHLVHGGLFFADGETANAEA